jgi:hypothetical protein
LLSTLLSSRDAKRSSNRDDWISWHSFLDENPYT